MFTAAASTGVPQAVAKFLPGSASIAGSGVSSDLMSQKVSSANVASRTGGMQFSESDQSQLAESLAGVISNQTADTRGSMWQSSNTSSIGEQASEVTSASQSYQESSAASSQIGSGLNTNAQHLGQRVSDTPAANQMLNDYFRANPHLNSLANERADFFGKMSMGWMLEPRSRHPEWMYCLGSRPMVVTSKPTRMVLTS